MYATRYDAGMSIPPSMSPLPSKSASSSSAYIFYRLRATCTYFNGSFLCILSTDVQTLLLGLDVALGPPTCDYAATSHLYSPHILIPSLFYPEEKCTLVTDDFQFHSTVLVYVMATPSETKVSTGPNCSCDVSNTNRLSLATNRMSPTTAYHSICYSYL